VLLHRRILAAGSPARIIAAHAGYGLELELGGAIEVAAVAARLRELSFVSAVSVEDRRLSIRGSERVRELKDRAFEIVAELGGLVLAFRLREPDLESAYFELIGPAAERGTGFNAVARQGEPRKGRA
jgi:hypothetical protein